jgi:hypothetical protein
MRTCVTLSVICAVVVAGLAVRAFVPGDPTPWHLRLAEVALACACMAFAIHVHGPVLPGPPPANGQTSPAPRARSELVQWLLAPFLALALLGLMLSMASHLCGVLGLPQPLDGVLRGGCGHDVLG